MLFLSLKKKKNFIFATLKSLKLYSFEQHFCFFAVQFVGNVNGSVGSSVCGGVCLSDINERLSPISSS